MKLSDYTAQELASIVPPRQLNRYFSPDDVVGQRQGRLEILQFVGYGHHALYRCRCDCGNELIIDRANLVGGNQQSCGCLRDEDTAKRLTKHGRFKTREFNSWRAMKERCLNPKSCNYEWYGARGITICERWMAFSNFFADMGQCPPGHSIERKDVLGNYEPNNCIWLPKRDQAKNRRSSRIHPRALPASQQRPQ
jgi:hypothetical protein